MASEKASGLSILAVVFAFGSLVAAWLAVPGFPYSPFQPAQTQSTEPETRSVTDANRPAMAPDQPSDSPQHTDPVGHQSSYPNPGSITPRDEIKVDEPDRALPDVVAAADDALNSLRSHSYIVQGHLRARQSQPDEQLQGVITTDLTLDVTLSNVQGTVLDAFTITSRGGGFTSDASALQARERLRATLRQRLSKEHP